MTETSAAAPSKATSLDWLSRYGHTGYLYTTSKATGASASGAPRAHSRTTRGYPESVMSPAAPVEVPTSSSSRESQETRDL